MNKEKQIEGMAKVIKSSLDSLGCGNFNFTGEEISTMFAKALYTAGYRKQSEGEWIKLRYGKADLVTHMKCSNCERVETLNYQYKYCPHCGAHMKGGAE